MCLPRMAFYELYITIPAIFYLSNKFFYSSNKFLSNLGFIFLIIMFGVHDINAIFYLIEKLNNNTRTKYRKNSCHSIS